MMKKVIKSVLEKFGTQTNLGSESARERITDEIVEALHKNDNYLYEDAGDGHMLKVDKLIFHLQINVKYVMDQLII